MASECLYTFSITQQKCKNIPKLSTSSSWIIIGVARMEGLVRSSQALNVCGNVSGKISKQLSYMFFRHYTSIKGKELVLPMGRQRKRKHPKMMKASESLAGSDILPEYVSTCYDNLVLLKAVRSWSDLNPCVIIPISLFELWLHHIQGQYSLMFIAEHK